MEQQTQIQPTDFVSLYETYADKIYRFVYFRTQHKQIAEDLTSDIFFKAFKKFSSFDPTSSFTAWIYTIARNTIIDHYRQHKSTEDLASLEESNNTPTTRGPSLEQEVHNRLLLEKIQAKLSELPPKDREIITLRVYDGLSHKEIASIMSTTEAASKVAFLRAMKKLDATSLLLLLTVSFSRL